MKQLPHEKTSLLLFNESCKPNKHTFLSLSNNDNISGSSTSKCVDTKYKTKKKNKKKFCSSIGGIICIVVAVIDWVLMSELIQSAEQSNYNKPFFLRFMVNSTYCLMIIPWVFVYFFRSSTIVSLSSSSTSSSSSSSSTSKSSSVKNSPRSRIRNTINQSKCVLNNNNKFQLLFAVFLVNLCNIFAGYLWNLSLINTSAAINNTIFQSNCICVLIFSYCLLNEKINIKKSFAVLISIFGVILISYSSTSTSSSSSIIGIVLCILAMTFYGLFETLFSFYSFKFFRFGYELQDTLFFQFLMGLMNLILFWPFLILLNYLNIEIFELPSNINEFISGLLLPSLLDMLFTSSLLIGITLSNAISMSIGLIMVIPSTFFADIIIFHKQSVNIINIYSILGVICIFIGFLLAQVNHNKEKKDN